MANIYLIFVVILFLLAVSDLVVGISNDAANFLNSAIGSKVAPLKIILAIAGLGVVIGATFSSGMMEVARSGIFHPGQFYFSEVMIIFLAVMITDVMLLDTFNTFGFPTSTTVSIVFELLGAAVAISLVKIFNSTDTLGDLNNYINSAKALAIISGILLSVVIAFTCGMIIQFITRLIFSFDYEKNLKRFGAIWGGIAISAIVYFILVKGAKGASFMTLENVEWLHNNTWKILLASFLIFGLILQLLISIFKFNILRIIVLVGTFSLAMAFAGNDLVNFIGVPLAGFESFKEFISDPSYNPDTHAMVSLIQPVKTPTLFLLIAGTIMVFTLFLSRKARTVSQTEISLARQEEGSERFSSSIISRSVVRVTVGMSKMFNKFMPQAVNQFIENRFDFTSQVKKKKSKKSAYSFDLLRASVNMFVASILIATGTSLKLPLSTTYVTFMVSMGTSLSDRAWGRESAVYRITGVVSVITGWFFTAFIAFTVSLCIAFFLNWSGIIGIFVALSLALFFVIRTNFIHKKIYNKQHKKDEFEDRDSLNGEHILDRCNASIMDISSEVSKLYFSSIINLIQENRKKMKKVQKKVREINLNTKDLKNNIYPTLKKLEEGYVETGHFYVQVLDYLREVTHCLTFIADPIFEHIDNNHPSLPAEQVRDLHELNELISTFFSEIQLTFKNQRFDDITRILELQKRIIDMIARSKKRQIKLIKEGVVGTRNIMMYLNLLSESKNLVLYSVNMVKSQRDFLQSEEIRNGI